VTRWAESINRFLAGTEGMPDADVQRMLGIRGWKVLLVPEDSIHETAACKEAGEAYVAARHGGDARTLTGPFEVVGEVAPDGRLRMSRALYDTIEVVEPS
jgi:hypothetical protein